MKKALSYFPVVVLCLFLAFSMGWQFTSNLSAATPVVRSEQMVGTVIGIHYALRGRGTNSAFGHLYSVDLGDHGLVMIDDETLHPIGSPISIVRKTHINGWVEYDVAGR